MLALVSAMKRKAESSNRAAGQVGVGAESAPSKKQKTLAADATRSWKEVGQTYDKGRFSDAERNALKRAIDEYATSVGKTAKELISGKKCRARSANASAWMKIVEIARLPR